MHLHDHVLAVLGPPHTEVESLVGLLQDQGVLVGVAADAVSPQLVGPIGRIGPRVEEGGVVVRPCHAVRRSLDGVGEVLAGPEVAHPQGEALVPGGVGGVGEPGVARAHGQVGDVEIGVALGEEVLVEEHLFVGAAPDVHDGRSGGVESGARDREAAMDDVPGALDGALVVPPRPLGHRDAQVRLDDARPDLGEQGLAQPGEMRRPGRGERVLGPQVGEDLGVVAVAQPEPVVDPAVPVGLEDRGAAGGDRWALLGGRAGIGTGHRRMIPDGPPRGRSTARGLLLSR